METFKLSTELKQLITTDQAWHYFIIPANEQQGVLSFWYSENKNDKNELQNELLVLLGKEIILNPQGNDWIINQLSRYYPRDEREHKDGPLMELKGGSHTDLLSRMIEEICKIIFL